MGEDNAGDDDLLNMKIETKTKNEDSEDNYIVKIYDKSQRLGEDNEEAKKNHLPQQVLVKPEQTKLKVKSQIPNQSEMKLYF